jgi:hypothetical protein
MMIWTFWIKALNKIYLINKKSRIQTLALEAETTISQLKDTDQNYMHNLAAKNINELIKQNDLHKPQKISNEIV